MKMFKRFAAALLVGVMALAMLTACGERTSKIGKEFEDAALAAINTARGAAGAEALKNDEELRDKALGQLCYIKGDGTIAKENAGVVTVLAKDETKNTVKFLVVSVLAEKDKDGVIKAKEITADVLKQISSALNDPTVKSFQKIGIATKVVNGKTYAAAAYEVEVDASELEH